MSICALICKLTLLAKLATMPDYTISTIPSPPWPLMTYTASPLYNNDLQQWHSYCIACMQQWHMLESTPSSYSHSSSMPTTHTSSIVKSCKISQDFNLLLSASFTHLSASQHLLLKPHLRTICEMLLSIVGYKAHIYRLLFLLKSVVRYLETMNADQVV